MKTGGFRPPEMTSDHRFSLHKSISGPIRFTVLRFNRHPPPTGRPKTKRSKSAQPDRRYARFRVRPVQSDFENVGRYDTCPQITPCTVPPPPHILLQPPISSVSLQINHRICNSRSFIPFRGQLSHIIFQFPTLSLSVVFGPGASNSFSRFRSFLVVRVHCGDPITCVFMCLSSECVSHYVFFYVCMFNKRGVACFSKKYKDEDYKIEFDQNNLPVGPNKHKFVSWFGLKCKQMFPYHIKTTDFERYMWDELWLETKELWKIQSNAPKDTMERKAKKLCTNFRSRLVTHYINLGKTPFSDYKYLDPAHWKEFCKEKTKKEFLDKSKKARASAKANKNVPRVGRSGYTGMKSDIIWPQLLAKYSCLKNLRSLRSKKWLTSRAKKNKETNKYELEPDALLTLNLLVDTEKKMIEDKSYFEGKEDPLVRVLGREHGGRSRTVSGIIGFTKVHGGLYEGGTQRVRSDVNHEQKVTPCELLFPYKLSMELPLAFGQAWPTSDMTLDEGQIKEGCVKVHVDAVDKDFAKTPVPDVTRTDDIVFVGDTLFNFI
ncbi:hypothetical protein Hdeb2414_s0154g00815811 [Helianthus debilis subsp. tardiflorus]